MGVACVIGPGEQEWFRRCRRAWDFGSPNRRNWERRDARPRDLAMAVRQALAVWYFPGMWEWPRPIVLPRALQAFDEAAAAKEGRPAADEQGIRSVRRMLERYFVWAPTVDAFAPVRVEADFEANIPDPRTPGHDLVDREGRAVRYQDRLHLLVVDRNDAYWVVEHRLTQDGWADRDELFLAERPVTAAWGWEQFYCMVITGTLHNELRLVDESEAPSAGELAESAVARRPRPRDWARSRFAGRRTEERDDVVVEDGGGWFRRTWVPRRRAELDAVADHLFGEAVEMLDVGVGLYPSPAPEHCSRCDYRLPCIAMNRGTDVDGVLADAYRRREADHPEEGRLGGGTWSMKPGGRTAAPVAPTPALKPMPPLRPAEAIGWGLMDRQAAAGVSEEIRCPSCTRPLVLRSGPQITPHFAHRPRQSCRRRPGRASVTPLRLEQLTLFDVAPLTAPPPVPVFYFGPRPVPMQPAVPAPHASPRPATLRRRRRRRAWLPRLMNWFRIRAGSA